MYHNLFWFKINSIVFDTKYTVFTLKPLGFVSDLKAKRFLRLKTACWVIFFLVFIKF